MWCSEPPWIPISKCKIAQCWLCLNSFISRKATQERVWKLIYRNISEVAHGRWEHCSQSQVRKRKSPSGGNLRNFVVFPSEIREVDTRKHTYHLL